MLPETLKRLEDARLACVRIGEFTKGVSRAEFIASDLLRSAVERQVEIIGEALGRAAAADADADARIPQLRKIVGMRNRLIHGYDEVDYNIVWDVVTVHVPGLHRELNLVLDAGDA
ncbi:MAG: DUF86 domain-containing protein [Opitutaceae bacterium]|nr:DUF86 domain-containing protein [Opitutaceae bacterium]